VATLPLAPKTDSSELPNKRVHGPDSNKVREIAHELMNQLTVIELCVFHLGSMDRPVGATPLATLERTVKHALRTAKQLAAQINQPNIGNPDHSGRGQISQSVKPATFTAP